MYKILITDLEVENHEWYGNLASPFHPENYIVAPGWRVDTVHDDGSIEFGEVKHRYFNNIAEADAGADWFDVLDECSIMVCHNMQFEAKWFLSKHRQKFEAFIKRGGRMLCTALGHYLVSHQTELYPALDDVAPLYGGTHKIDAVKILWQQGKKTSEIDRDLLIEYLAGPEGDIENTAAAFYGEMQKLNEMGMWRMFLERSDAVLAYAYCEWFGLHVDLPTAHANMAEQKAEIARLQGELSKLLPDDLPTEIEFGWHNRYHLSALIYGGPIKYRKKVPYDPVQYVKADFYKFGNILVPVTDTEPGTDDFDLKEDTYGLVQRYASGKNKGQIKVFREDTTEEKLKWGDASHLMPGLVKFSQLEPALASKYTSSRAEFKGAQFLCDGTTPVYSTSEDALKGLKPFCPEVKLILDLATLVKDTGTYYLSEEMDEDGNVVKTKGMLQYVGPDSIVHHSLNATATVTGRLSSSTPNLQNLPRDGTSKVKQMFTSRFGPDGRIIEVDYSALEVVMLCALTGDTDLLKLLQSGTDMHCYRLAFKLGEPYEDVLEKCKNEDHPEHVKYHRMRTDIKPLSFADQYGASAEGIAFNTGCTVEFAQEFQDNEAKMFPISRGYRQVIRDEVERTGSFPDGIHREQTDDGRWIVYRRGYFQAPGGTCYSFRQNPKWDKETRQSVMDYKDTQLANYPFQGEAGFMMAVSMGRIMRHCVQHDWYDNQVCLINNVHDAAYLDAANEVVGREAALDTQAIMADAPVYMNNIWPEYNMGHVPFPAAAEMGISMYDKSHVHSD